MLPPAGLVAVEHVDREFVNPLDRRAPEAVGHVVAALPRLDAVPSIGAQQLVHTAMIDSPNRRDQARRVLGRVDPDAARTVLGDTLTASAHLGRTCDLRHPWARRRTNGSA